jgi:DNA-binding NarL/FixJ family response regulator
MSLTVLVVDDHAGFRSSVRHLLERFCCCLRVLEAESGEASLALVAEETPDLILMDINLPGQDGLQTTREILRLQPKMPIFIITSLEADFYLDEAQALGAWGIVSKCDLSARTLEGFMNQVAQGKPDARPEQ